MNNYCFKKVFLEQIYSSWALCSFTEIPFRTVAKTYFKKGTKTPEKASSLKKFEKRNRSATGCLTINLFKTAFKNYFPNDVQCKVFSALIRSNNAAKRTSIACPNRLSIVSVDISLQQLWNVNVWWGTLKAGTGIVMIKTMLMTTTGTMTMTMSTVAVAVAVTVVTKIQEKATVSNWNVSKYICKNWI